MRADPGGSQSKPRRVRRKPTVVAAPKGDIASSGGDYGMREAKRAEKSAPVKRAQRAVYDAQPTAQKQRIVRNATGAVKANVKPIHDARVERNRQIAKDAAAKDTKGNTDRGRAAAYLLAHPEILHPDHPHHGSLMATITGAAKLGQAGAKLASDAAAKVAPIAVAAYAPAITATAHALGQGKTFTKVTSNAGRDLIDIPANTVPSTYHLADTAIHDPKKAAHELVQPYVDFYHHPGKSFVDHPIGTGLLLYGAKGGIGRGVGKALRVAPSKALRDVASTERSAVAGPGGIAAEQTRSYSKDIITKGAQVAREKVKARRAVKKGKPVEAPTMSERQIETRVDENVSAGRAIAGHNETHAAAQAKKALGKKPNAVTSAVAQGIVAPTRADISAYIGELQQAATKLSGEALKRNVETRKMLSDALKHHDPAKVEQAARAYQALRAPVEAETIARGMVKPDVAEATRLAGVAVRRFGVQTGAEATRLAKADAKEARKQAARTVRKAKRAAVVADAEHSHALANARVSSARVNQSLTLRELERQRDRAVAHAAKVKRTASSEAAKAATQAVRDLEQRIADARVAQSVPKPEVVAAEREATQATARVRKLKTSTVTKAELQVQRAVGDARVTVARAKRSTTLAQAEKARASAARDLALLQRAHRGREYTLEHAVKLRAARARVKDADRVVVRERRRISGVPPEQHDALLRALAERDQAKAGTSVVRDAEATAKAANQKATVVRRRVAGVPPELQDSLLRAIATRDQAVRAVSTAGRDEVAAARAHVKVAEDAVAAERRRLSGVAPAEAAALGKTIAAKDSARATLRQARRGAADKRQAHVDTKKELAQGGFVGPNGDVIPLADVRAAHTGVDPVYVSHNPGGDVRPAAVPTEPPSLAVKAVRSGKAVEEGTLDLHPDRMIQQAADSQRRLDAGKNYQRFLDEFSHREKKGDAPKTYRDESRAEIAAGELKDQTGIDWVAARKMGGGFHLVPKAAAARLAKHAAQNDSVMSAFTRQWSKNVLAFSPRWLAGQLVEPVVRATIAHAGPRSMVTGVKTIRRLNAEEGIQPRTAGQVLRRVPKPEDSAAAKEFKARTMSSGLQRTAMRPLEHHGAQKEYAGLAKAVHDLPKKPVGKQLVGVYNAVTNFTLGTLNHIVQTPSQYAFVGKAIRDSHLMTAHTKKLSEAAIHDFVTNGGKDVNVMAALGREVDRMNGKYNKFSPKQQAWIAGYTPFLAWTLAATRFLFDVLPRDHPALTAALVSANQATENWRKANGLQFDPFKSGQEGWLQGSIPGNAGSHLRVGRYVPFGLANDDYPIIGPYASAVLPQASGIIAAFKGQDWMGNSLTPHEKPSEGRVVAAAGSSFLSGVVPLASQVLHVGGIRTPDMKDSTKIKPGVEARARSQFDPFMYTPGHVTGGAPAGSVTVAPVKVQAVKVKPVKVRAIKPQK